VRRLVLVALLAPIPVACGQPADLEVTDAWTRDTVGGSNAAAVFMTISAPSGDRLVAASSPIAAKTDLMTMTGGSSAMEMTYIDDIAIPAGTPVSLDPSGLHVWLADLQQPLKAGETFPLTLEFDNAGARRIVVSVLAPTAAAPVAGRQR
jgi:periplasmic copper chaperone A